MIERPRTTELDGFTIVTDCSPTLAPTTRAFDWSATLDSDDSRTGYGATEQAAIEDLLKIVWMDDL